MQLGCPPVKLKGSLMALAGAAAVAGIAIGFTVGGGTGTTVETRAEKAAGGTSTNGTTAVDATSVSGTTTSSSSSTSSTGTTTGETGPVGPIPRPRKARLGHKLLVATVDDALKQADPAVAAALMSLSRKAGFDAVMVSSMWAPGL